MSIKNISECLSNLHNSGSRIIYTKTLTFEREFIWILVKSSNEKELVEKMKEFCDKLNKFMKKLDELKEFF